MQARPTHRTALATAATAAVAALVAVLLLLQPAPAHAASADLAAGPWAQRVCSAVVDWSTAAGVKEKALEKAINPASMKTTRAVFSRFLDEMVGETDRMIARVDAAGTPKVKNGAGMRQGLRALLVQARGALAAARRTAAGMSLTDRAAFAKTASAIGDTIGKQFDALGGAFDRLDRQYPSPELDRAVAAAPSCKRL